MSHNAWKPAAVLQTVIWPYFAWQETREQPDRSVTLHTRTRQKIARPPQQQQLNTHTQNSNSAQRIPFQRYSTWLSTRTATPWTLARPCCSRCPRTSRQTFARPRTHTARCASQRAPFRLPDAAPHPQAACTQTRHPRGHHQSCGCRTRSCQVRSTVEPLSLLSGWGLKVGSGSNCRSV